VSALYALEGVAFAYDGAPALQVERLEIETGAVTAVTGPNGAGKSTLLNLLAFLEGPTAGTIRFAGRAVGPGTQAALRRRVGLVPQNPYLLRGTVADNVTLGLKLRGVPERAREAAARDAMERLGLVPLAGRPARRLSGGEAQKVAIARALALSPEVLLLDEPFTYLDTPALLAVERLVREVAAEGRTVVLTAHDAARAGALADRTVGLAGGHVVPAVPVNLFHGRVVRDAGGEAVFDTGRIRVHLPDGAPGGSHLAVEANRVVLSARPLDSSMRNAFRGRIVALTDLGASVRVRVAADEPFEAEVTAATAAEPAYALGREVWLSFKSTAVTVF